MKTQLSKSRFLSGQQCDLRLWYAVHERHLATPPDAVQEALFATGREVGALARERFPGGVLVDQDHLHGREAVARTAGLLLDKSVPAIYEGGFEHQGVLIRTDILVRCPEGGWELVEVKSSTRVKDEHQIDVAIQLWVLRGAGLDVRRVGVLTLDREYCWLEGNYDLEVLFRLNDCTDSANALLPGITPEVARLHALLAGKEAPVVAPGAQCTSPYECPYLAHCSKGAVEPEWPISILPALRGKRLGGLEEMGVDDVRDIPEDYELTPGQEIVRTAVQSDSEQIHADLTTALSTIEFPVHYLDFESANPALPRYPGTHPYDAVPFQFSIHTERSDGSVSHAEYLHPDGSDPREPLANAMLGVLGQAGTVVVYSSYEKTTINRLAEALPSLAPRLEVLLPRLCDLLKVVKDGYYHPDFRGSFSIKSVLPVLSPELSYKDLEIGEGNLAAIRYLRALDTADPLERERTFAALREYCGRDTLGLVHVRRALKARAETNRHSHPVETSF